MSDVLAMSKAAARAYDRADYTEAHRLYEQLVGLLVAGGWPEDEVAVFRELRDRSQHMRRVVVIAR